MSHTPGPWSYHRTHLCSSDYWYVVVDPNGRGPIIEVGGNDKSGQIGEMKHLITDPDIIEANARLIVRAVNCHYELLEALKDAEFALVVFRESAGKTPHALITVREAIAKAEGKA